MILVSKRAKWLTCIKKHLIANKKTRQNIANEKNNRNFALCFS